MNVVYGIGISAALAAIGLVCLETWGPRKIKNYLLSLRGFKPE